MTEVPRDMTEVPRETCPDCPEDGLCLYHHREMVDDAMEDRAWQEYKESPDYSLEISDRWYPR